MKFHVTQNIDFRGTPLHAYPIYPPPWRLYAWVRRRRRPKLQMAGCHRALSTMWSNSLKSSLKHYISDISRKITKKNFCWIGSKSSFALISVYFRVVWLENYGRFYASINASQGHVNILKLQRKTHLESSAKVHTEGMSNFCNVSVKTPIFQRRL